MIMNRETLRREKEYLVIELSECTDKLTLHVDKVRGLSIHNIYIHNSINFLAIL